MGALMVLCIATVSVVACAVTVYRTRVARADREAERRWFAEEQSWWAQLRTPASDLA